MANINLALTMADMMCPVRAHKDGRMVNYKYVAIVAKWLGVLSIKELQTDGDHIQQQWISRPRRWNQEIAELREQVEQYRNQYSIAQDEKEEEHLKTEVLAMKGNHRII